MSYVDALLDKNTDRIHVVERVNGQRVYKEYPANYLFYYDDPKGKFRTIYDTPVTRVTCRSGKDFQKEIRLHNNKRLWESDINPVFRCLSDNYLGSPSPDLHIAFFDIEVDFDNIRGFSPPEDPFNRITAISVYLSWLDQLVTLSLPPRYMDFDKAKAISDKFDNSFIFEDEAAMLDTFLNLIDDADIVSGWNSEGYDIPYTVNRIARVLSKNDTKRYCLWGQSPKMRKFERFGAEQITYDLVGRVHLDYMQLYRKYTYEERHSYSLDAIGEHELNERKIAYEGSLDQLYNNDFEKFLDYNRQDTLLLYKLDKKLTFIDLANELAHENTILLMTTMGAVAVTEQAIINESHGKNLIVPNRRGRANGEDETESTAAGAYVAYPKTGLHDWIGAIDINSLYPSVIRALNMAPETIVGQLRPTMTDKYIADKLKAGESFAGAWENMFGTLEYQAVMDKEIGTILTVDWVDGSSTELSAAEVYHMVFVDNQPWTISANGTIFTYEKKGIVPGLLERWYSERKEMQAKKKAATDPKEIGFWDKRQLVKKIQLNSLYGAILNKGCRFEDHRIGQSTTLTGRCITKHMGATVNLNLDDKYDHTGRTVIYGDTDSVYFSAWPVMSESKDVTWNKDVCVQVYDAVADQVNDSFPKFMSDAFHCPRQNGEIIKAGRELVGSKSLFITKKRYAILIYDLEGKRLDTDGKTGKIKAMGLDLKRSDTPKAVQDFLMDVLTDTLNGVPKEDIINRIKQYKEEFKLKPSWEKGTPKRVNNLTHFTNMMDTRTKGTVPGHVRAAYNWNKLRRMNSDNRTTAITDGMKTIVCKLKQNPLGLKSIGYPTDELQLPQWFKDLPFDDFEMEAAIIDQKLNNLLGVLEWDIVNNTNVNNTFENLFSF